MIQGVSAVVKWVFSGVRIFLPVIPATRPVTLRGPGVPMNTSSDAGRGGMGNAKTQGRNEKWIPAYAGMTWVGAGMAGGNGGTQRRKDAMKSGFPPTRE